MDPHERLQSQITAIWNTFDRATAPLLGRLIRLDDAIERARNREYLARTRRFYGGSRQSDLLWRELDNEVRERRRVAWNAYKSEVERLAQEREDAVKVAYLAYAHASVRQLDVL
jgi:hypothetical protein